MKSQQMSEQGYMAPAGQTNDVAAAASVMQQQGIYTDSGSAGWIVASLANLTQADSDLSNLSPSANIPVTGTGPPPLLATVPCVQHSHHAYPTLPKLRMSDSGLNL